ncbi:MAG TPA: hypothetical protein VFY74_03865 [Methyloceanibacter sp.]|jgi:hypothetical protein|nr:hypothetical protein [Methyloceanibacter sp.]
MRDILADLRDRARFLEQEIHAENARFDQQVSGLTAERDGAIQHMRAQLLLANKLIEFTAWHHKVRTVLAAHIAVAEIAENSIARSLQAGAELSRSS